MPGYWISLDSLVPGIISDFLDEAGLTAGAGIFLGTQKRAGISHKIFGILRKNPPSGRFPILDPEQLITTPLNPNPVKFGHWRAKEPLARSAKARNEILSEEKNFPYSHSQSFVPELQISFDLEKTTEKTKRPHRSSVIDPPSPDPVPQPELSQIPHFEHRFLWDLHPEPISLD